MIRSRKYMLEKIIILVFVILCFGGCAINNAADDANGLSQAGVENAAPLQWQTQGFIVHDSTFMIDMNASEIYCEVASGEIVLPQDIRAEYEENTLESWCHNNYYVLLEKMEAGRRTYALARDGGSMGKCEIVELPGIKELGHGRIVCLDVVTQENIALLYIEQKDDKDLKEVCILHINEKGEITTKTNVLEGYGTEGIRPDELVQGFWGSDKAGNSYLIRDGGRKLLIFDEAGTLLKKLEYPVPEEKQVLKGFHAPEGEVIFAVSDMLEGKTRIMWWDTSKSRFEELAAFPEMYMRGFSMYEDGNIYFVYQSRLWKWNVSTGEGTVLYNILGSSIPGNGMDEYVTHISVLKEEEIEVISRAGEGFQYCLLSSADPEDTGMVLLDLIGETYIRECVVGYNKEHPEITIQYERKSDDEENWTRTMAELSSGKGPDMIFMWAGDERVETLYEKGVLMDLSNVLSEETLSQIFPGILEIGTIGDKLVGICPKGIPIVYWTANSLWHKDWWSNEDILAIVADNPRLEGLYVSDSGSSASSNLSFLALSHMENSTYVDSVRRVSNFDAKGFIETLEMAKKYSEMPVVKGQEKVEKIKDGEYLTTFEYVFEPSAFVEMVEKYGDACHMIGCPGQTEYVGYWSSTGIVLVNAKSEHREKVIAFLEFLLCEQNQQKVMQTCVREDIVRNSVSYDEYTEAWYIKTGFGNVLFTKSTEESYLEDYVDFLKKLGPMGADSPIEDIVRQEAEEYFKGGRSAEEIADIIDNRVQLYLEEQLQ